MKIFNRAYIWVIALFALGSFWAIIQTAWEQGGLGWVIIIALMGIPTLFAVANALDKDSHRRIWDGKMPE